MSRRIFRLSMFLLFVGAIFISGTARGVTKGLSEEEALGESRQGYHVFSEMEQKRL